MPASLRPEVVARALELYDRGVPVSTIRHELGCSTTAFYVHLAKAAGARRRTRGAAEARQARAVALYQDEGFEVHAIAEELLVTKAAVYMYLKGAGIELRQRVSEPLCLNRCGRRVRVAQSLVGRKSYCSKVCASAAQLNLGRPRNTVQRQFRQWLAEGHTLAEAAGQVGCAPGTLRRWFTESRALSREHLAGVAGLLGISFDQALREAGGSTAEDVWSRTGRANAHHLEAGRTPEARARAGATMRGRPKSPEHVEAIRAGVLAAVARAEAWPPPEARAGWEAWRASDPGLLLPPLAGWTRHHPEPRREHVIAFALAIAAREGFTPERILEVWQVPAPRLDLGRVFFVQGAMDGWPRDQDGRLEEGFWPAAAETLGLGPGSLKRWAARMRSSLGVLRADASLPSWSSTPTHGPSYQRAQSLIARHLSSAGQRRPRSAQAATTREPFTAEQLRKVRSTLRSKSLLSRTDVFGILGRHVSADVMDAIRDHLDGLGLLVVEQIATGSRPLEAWRLP